MSSFQPHATPSIYLFFSFVRFHYDTIEQIYVYNNLYISNTLLQLINGKIIVTWIMFTHQLQHIASINCEIYSIPNIVLYFFPTLLLIFSFLSWHKFLRKCKDHKCQTRNLGKTEVCSSSGHVLNESRSVESKSHSTLKEKFFLKKKKNFKRKVCISCNRHGTVFFFFGCKLLLLL